MKTSEIQKILQDQLEQDGLQRIVINGDWGVGKTYQVNNFIEKHKKDENLKIIKVSLFGKKSVDEINDTIYGEIGKSKKFFKEVLNFVSNLSVSYEFFSMSVPDMSHWIGEAKFKKGKKVLIIFDDFERKCTELTTKSILGYIDNLCSSNPSVKVVLIMCKNRYEEEDSTEKDNKLFEDFKEKTFNKTFNIDAVDQEIIHQIVKEFADKNNLKINITEYIENHFKELGTTNLRTLLAILSELSLYLKSKILENTLRDDEKTLKDDTLKILINCLINVVYDCKTNELLKEYETDIAQSQKNGAIFNWIFVETKDEDEKRVMAIMRKCHLLGVSNYSTKHDIIESILKKYLYLDESYDEMLKKQLSTEKKDEDIYQSLFLFSDSEREKRAKQQYNDIIKTKKVSDIGKIMNDWYENLGQDFIDKTFDLNRLSEALIEGSKEKSFYLFQTNIVLRYNGYDKHVYDFIESFNKKLYEERIKIVCQGLCESDRNKWKHLVEYIIQYKEDISIQDKIDSKIEDCLSKNNYFVNRIKGNISQDEYENMCSLINFYRNECSENFSKKFDKFLDKEIANTTEKSYAQRLSYIKLIGK